MRDGEALNHARGALCLSLEEGGVQGGGVLGEDVRLFLAEFWLTTTDIATWVCHPGGPKVIEAVESVLELPDDALDRTRTSLWENGNLSSVSVLDVLAANLAEPPAEGELGMMIAMGPGFCSELVLLGW